MAYLANVATEQQLSQAVAEQLVGSSLAYPEPRETGYSFGLLLLVFYLSESGLVVSFRPVAEHSVEVQRLKYQHSVFCDRANEFPCYALT